MRLGDVLALVTGLAACAGTASTTPRPGHQPGPTSDTPRTTTNITSSSTSTSTAPTPTPPPAPGPTPTPPIGPPAAGAQGCVPEASYAAYGKALDTHARGELDRALARHGARAVTRSAFTIGSYGDDETVMGVGHSYEVKGRRFLVVGHATPSPLAGTTTTTTIAITKDNAVHPLVDEITSHEVLVNACLPCDPGRGVREREPAPLVVELQPGEQPGAELRAVYTRWHANYTNRHCNHASPPP